jgi:hypothetical protein
MFGPQAVPSRVEYTEQSERFLSLLKNIQTASYSMDTRVPSVAVKQPGCKTDH